MPEKLILHKNHLETESDFVCSKDQVRRILGIGGKKKQTTYTQDTPLLGDSHHQCTNIYPVQRSPNGAITIGCMDFTKEQVEQIRKWAVGKKKPIKKTKK